MSEENKEILEFILDLTLDEHMGDVGNTIDSKLKEIGYDEDWYTLHELAEQLKNRGLKYRHERDES